MSNIKTISYGKSFEIVTPIGTVWEKIGLEAELGERETPEEGLLELKAVVEQFHVEHSGQEIPPQDTFTTVPGTKKDKRVPDLAVRVKYAKAASEMDEETIAKLESEYQF
jgi:hypothetical protein